MNIYKLFLKRAIDILVSGMALIVLFIPLVFITIWLHYANKGAGAFFVQERPGKNGKIFKIYKFKSMTDAVDDKGKLLPDVQRLTKVGNFVRKTSIDELPQLWNVFKGDMSLIGPRPLKVSYLPWYTDHEQHRHDVRPGITGWAQTHGRNNNTWEDQFDLDVWYVENLSFSTDCKIIYSTIINVIKRSDIAIANRPDLDEYRKKTHESL